MTEINGLSFVSLKNKTTLLCNKVLTLNKHCERSKSQNFLFLKNNLPGKLQFQGASLITRLNRFTRSIMFKKLPSFKLKLWLSSF